MVKAGREEDDKVKICGNIATGGTLIKIATEEIRKVLNLVFRILYKKSIASKRSFIVNKLWFHKTIRRVFRDFSKRKIGVFSHEDSQHTAVYNITMINITACIFLSI